MGLVTEVEEDIVMLVNAVEATLWPLWSKNLKFPEHQVALATLQTGSSKDKCELEQELEQEELSDELSELTDCISMSTQVAVNVEVVPKSAISLALVCGS